MKEQNQEKDKSSLKFTLVVLPAFLALPAYEMLESQVHGAYDGSGKQPRHREVTDGGWGGLEKKPPALLFP